MRSSEGRSCITRVVVDGDREVELVALQSVMQRIRASLQNIPPTQRAYIANALLNLAVCRMLRETGTQRTSTILMRLLDVLEHEPPPLTAAIDLTATHS